MDTIRKLDEENISILSLTKRRPDKYLPVINKGEDVEIGICPNSAAMAVYLFSSVRRRQECFLTYKIAQPYGRFYSISEEIHVVRL